MKLRIQDLPSDRLDDAVDINIRYFSLEETFHRAVGKFIRPNRFLKTTTKDYYIYFY